MEGKVTSFDAKKGWVHVKTQEGTMIVHFPPSALHQRAREDGRRPPKRHPSSIRKI
jgi:hypothetical protein